MNKTEIKTILIRTVFVLAITAIMLFLTKPQQATLYAKPVLTDKSLSENRQVVLVAADSLLNLLTEIDEDYPGVFEIANEGSRMFFLALDEKPFNNIFLDGEYISRFENIANTGIETLQSEKGFSLPVVTKADIRYVRIPAEIMHSIQLQKRN